MTEAKYSKCITFENSFASIWSRVFIWSAVCDALWDLRFHNQYVPIHQNFIYLDTLIYTFTPLKPSKQYQMNSKSQLLRETLFFHENFSFESGTQPLDGRVWSAAGTALSQWMHSWASACIGSGGIPPNEEFVFHTPV